MRHRHDELQLPCLEPKFSWQKLAHADKMSETAQASKRVEPVQKAHVARVGGDGCRVEAITLTTPQSHTGRLPGVNAGFHQRACAAPTIVELHAARHLFRATPNAAGVGCDSFAVENSIMMAAEKSNNGVESPS